MNDLYSGYFKTAVCIALPIVKNYDTAQDIAQLSLIKVWEKQDAYDESKSAFYAWFRQIVVRTAIDKYRSENKRIILRDDIYEWDNFTCPCINIDTIDIEVNLNKIRLKYRTVLYLHHIEGETLKRISERLNTPLGTIKSQLKIGMRELRKIYIKPNK